MRKTNNYVAPVAEVIEMQMPVVLMASNDATGGNGTGNWVDPTASGGYGG